MSMVEMEKEADVLVIGGGLAGCWAAIRAKAFASRVILVDKATISRSGASAWAYYLLAPPQDIDIWKKELVERGDYLSDQDWVDVIMQEHGQRLSDMMAWGVPFELDEKGALIKKKGRGHDNTRFITSNGKRRMEALKQKARESGVEIIEGVMCTDLLTSDGLQPTSDTVIGAIGFQVRTSETVIFKSKAVVIASGPIYSGTNLCGDGTAMAFRVGAELMSMEFCIHPTCYMTDGKHYLGSLNVLFQSLGLKLLNSSKERFMEKYSPTLKERTHWALLSQAMIKETFDGKGPILLDMSEAKDEDIAFFAKLHPGRMAPFVNSGIDLKRDRIMVIPRVDLRSSSGDGGIKIDTHGNTSVRGLYAAGTACKNSIHGTYSVGGINLTFCCSSGYRAGETAAKFSLQQKIVHPDASQLAALRRAFLSQLGKENGPSSRSLITKMEKTFSPALVSIIKHEDRIKKTLETLDIMTQEVSNLRAKDIHELVKVRETDNVLLIAKLTFLSALERKESRYSHYREEYPFKDDVDWLKWTIVKNAGERGVKISTEPVPIDRYTVKPEPRRKVLHPVQFS